MDKPKMPDCDYMCDCLCSMSDGTASLHLSNCPVYVIAAHHAAWEAYCAKLEAERDALQVDAERYQLARRILTLTAIAPLARDYFRFGDYAYMQKVDAAIDAAREGERREG